MSVLTTGPTGQRGKEGERDTFLGLFPAGPWASSDPRPNRVPAAFYSFSFFFSLFFFCFLYSFILFAKMLQINSNHFQKYSKNQCNDLTLQEN
jgi:hypothetical protein